MQVSCSGVISQAGPVMQHQIYIGICQAVNVLEGVQETFVIGYNRSDLCLLQHDFRNPHPVG